MFIRESVPEGSDALTLELSASPVDEDVVSLEELPEASESVPEEADSEEPDSLADETVVVALLSVVVLSVPHPVTRDKASAEHVSSDIIFFFIVILHSGGIFLFRAYLGNLPCSEQRTL